ncbi:MAG: GNAT family N-acetyltransferase [Archaeoglobaceae archaeon]
MIVRPLKRSDLNDVIRILVLSFERELATIFRDVDLAREILGEFFEKNPEGCFVAEDGRVVGFLRITFEEQKIFGFLREKLGFIDGLRASLLLKFFVKNPKKGEGFVNFIVVSPFRRGNGIGSALMRRAIEEARIRNLKSLKCMISAGSESITFFEKFGFEIEKLIESKLAERYFSSKEWVILKKDLSI